MAPSHVRNEDSAEDASPAARPALAWPRERLNLPGLESWSTNLRTVFLNLLFLVAVIVVVPILVSQFRRDQVVIERIAVPDRMTEQGLSPEVVASRLWDGLQDVAAKARTAKATITALPDARAVEFSFPDSGFSIESLVFHTRRLFGAYETRIAGEFTCGDPGCAREAMRLRLRVIRDRVDIVDLPAVGERAERDYFALAASGVLSVLDPFVALAAAAQEEPLRATILARRLIRSRHADAHWAHNLIGNIRTEAGDLSGAIEEYRAALALRPGFALARANLGHSLRLSGDMAGARAAFDAVLRAEPANARALEGLAELALASGDSAEAVRRLEAAAAASPLEPRFLSRAGQVAMEGGDRATAERLLGRALEIDPGYLPAFAFLAALHLLDENYDRAELIYRDAADYAPEDAEAQAAHGRILAILKRCEDALPRFRRAGALDPGNAEHRLQEARCLQRLERHEEALAVLSEAVRLAPARGDVHMSMGDSLRDLGRKDEAISAYRKFLELDGDSIMRPVAERFIELLSG